MHPDCAGFITEFYAHCRQILVKGLTPEQLQLHDYYSSQDPLYEGDDCFEEFPLVDGLPELLLNEVEYDEPPRMPGEGLQESATLQLD